MAVFNQEFEPKLSLDYLKAIDNYTILQKPVQSFEEGMLSVRNGENRALITIGANFTKALTQRGLEGNFVEEMYITMGRVNLYLDMTSKASKITITSLINCL